MAERIACWAKVSVLCSMFFLPVIAAQWRREINEWWRSNHRLESPQSQRLMQGAANNRVDSLPQH
jgi:hypothetical protein